MMPMAVKIAAQRQQPVAAPAHLVAPLQACLAHRGGRLLRGIFARSRCCAAACLAVNHPIGYPHCARPSPTCGAPSCARPARAIRFEHLRLARRLLSPRRMEQRQRSRRHHSRKDVAWTAWVKVGSRRLRCHTVDLSANGTKLKPRAEMPPGTAVELQLEYTNDSSNDWDADVIVEWLDGKGEVIDGFRDELNLDEGDRRELKKATITTLRYGLDQARKLRIEIRTDPE